MADPVPASTTPAPKVNFSKPVFIARRGPFKYAGERYDYGQLFNLGGHRNDAKLITFGHVRAFDGKRGDTFECGECGGLFTTEPNRRKHGDERHRPDYRTDDEIELATDQHLKLLDRIEPFTNVGEAQPVVIE